MITRENFLEPEVRCGYKVTNEIKKLWKCQLDMLEEFIRICEKYKLRWQVDGGTLLGAVRHQGYIPWDDDLDVALPREDYEKFCEVAPKEVCKPFFVHTFMTDPDGVNKIARICNSETTFILNYRVKRKFTSNMGIFIDVIPLDVVPKDLNKRIKLLEKYLWAKKRLQLPYTRIQYSGWKKTLSEQIRKFKAWLWIQFQGGRKKAYKNVEGIICNYLFSPGEERLVGLATHAPWVKRYTQVFWEIEDRLGELIDLPFEYLSVKAPKNYERVLTVNYGNWREFDPNYQVHKVVEFYTDRPYPEVLVEKYGYKKNDFVTVQNLLSRFLDK